MVESLLFPPRSPTHIGVNGDVEEFLTDLELADKKLKTINNYRYVLAPFFRFAKKQFAEEINNDDVRRYFAEYKKTHKHNSYWIISERLKSFF